MALTGRLTVFAAGLMAAPAMAQNQGGYYGHGHMWDGSGWWMCPSSGILGQMAS